MVRRNDEGCNAASELFTKSSKRLSEIYLMLIYYITLGLTPDASDEQIRSNYLELVKRYTPEKAPERFRRITAAYEALKDIRNRLENLYMSPEHRSDTEVSLRSLIQIVFEKRHRVGLRELLDSRVCRS